MSFTSVPISLRTRVLRAGAWTIGGHFTGQAVRLGSNLIMTHLLVPEMFGVMTIAYVFMTGLAMFSDVGISQNIVQSRRGGEPMFLHTAWTVQILRGFVIFVIALALAFSDHLAIVNGLLPAGSVYANSALPHVLAVLSLSGLISGFESNRLALARRNLALSRVVALDIAGPAVALVVMVLWATIDRSIWALVAGGLSGTLTRTLLSHYALPGTPDRWGWDQSAFDEIIGFGKWVFLSSLLGFLVMNGDRLILGGLVDAKTLGIYSIAVTLVSALDAVLSKLSNDVALPALSEVTRDRPEEVRTVFYRFHFLIGSIALFSAGALLISGPDIIHILYDKRYLDAGWMIGIVAIGLAIAPCRIGTQCFIARGEPRVISAQTLIRLPALYLLTPLAFHFFGLVGALWAITLSALTCVPIVWLYQSTAGLFDSRREAVVWIALPFGLLAGLGVNWTVAHLLG